MNYDYLIIGAGLSGSTCAYLLARAGKSVLLVERRDALTKDKLCGGLMTPRAVDEFGAIFGSTNLSKLQTANHTTMRILFGTHDRTIPIPPVLGTRRAELDRFALSCALEAGSELVDQATVEDLDFENKRAVIHSGELWFATTYDCVIAADGVGSLTRKLVSKFVGADKVPPSTHPYPTLEAYVPAVNDQLTGRYLAAIKGYCWYAPCGEMANIGVGGSGVDASHQLREQLDSFAREMGVSLDSANARGAFIPRGENPCLRCEQAHAYLIGDAAGLANPITGEGIYLALRSAHLLAESLCGESAYERLMRRDLGALRKSLALIPVVYNDQNMNLVLSAAKVTGLGSGKAARFALRLFADL